MKPPKVKSFGGFAFNGNFCSDCCSDLDFDFDFCSDSCFCSGCSFAVPPYIRRDDPCYSLP